METSPAVTVFLRIIKEVCGRGLNVIKNILLLLLNIYYIGSKRKSIFIFNIQSNRENVNFACTKYSATALEKKEIFCTRLFQMINSGYFLSNTFFEVKK